MSLWTYRVQFTQKSNHKAMVKSTGFCFVKFDKHGTLIDAKPEEPGWRYQTGKERQ
jgi:hypothetical protein